MSVSQAFNSCITSLSTSLLRFGIAFSGVSQDGHFALCQRVYVHLQLWQVIPLTIGSCVPFMLSPQGPVYIKPMLVRILP